MAGTTVDGAAICRRAELGRLFDRILVPRQAELAMLEAGTDEHSSPDDLESVADSRTVALNHTAGLSTPVQVQMTLFSLFSLMDEEQRYKKSMKRIVLRRKQALYRELGLPMPIDPNSVHYYHLLDLKEIATQLHGEKFAHWLAQTLKPNEALFRLAEETGVILLPGRGFGTNDLSSRVSLANLNEYDYANIGKCISKLASEFYAEFVKLG